MQASPDGGRTLKRSPKFCLALLTLLGLPPTGPAIAQSTGTALPPPGYGAEADSAPAVTSAMPSGTVAAEIHATDLAILNAASYQPVPGSQAFAVILFDDSPSTEALRVSLEHALQDAGLTVNRETAPLHLSFDSTRTIAPRSPQAGILGLEGHGGSNENQIKTTLGVFSTTQSSLITGERSLPTGIPRLRFQLYLTDAQSGKRLWEGWGTTSLGTRSAEDAAQKMLPALIENIGKTVRNQAISLGRD